MQKYESGADVLILKNLIYDLRTRCLRQVERGLGDFDTLLFLEETAHRRISDLEQHPLGDKRVYITRLLNEVVKCEEVVVGIENELRH